MASINIGQVRMNFKGTWDINKSYGVLDYVYYHSTETALENIYVALKDVPSNTQITNTEYWLKISVQGPSQNALVHFTATVTPSMWQDINVSAELPFSKKALVLLEGFSKDNYSMLLLANDNIVEFSRYCFGIKQVSEQGIVTLYSIGCPTTNFSFNFYASILQ